MFLRVAVVIALLGLGGAPHPPAPVPAVKTPAAARPDLQSPRNASYRISARLDTRQRTITGNEVITWRNISNRSATTLQFHLYYNAWRDTRSSFMREQALSFDSAAPDAPAEDGGWIDLTSMRVRRGSGAADLFPRLRFIAPDDGNGDDRTVVEAPLDAAVDPGETIEIQIGWTSHVPRTFARTGAIDDFYFIAQWFPKIGVLEDAGWNCHQFHWSTEFFSDFGTYDVELDVPRGWIVGATGREAARTDSGSDRTVHRYVEQDVHDFAWTASPRYIERRAQFEHPSLPAVDMRLLLQPEHVAQAERHFTATRAALRHYGEWFGAYPYGHITIVDPAWQSEADGMEYPTLFTAGTRWIAPREEGEPEDVVVHEAGHQFWYGIVASNEFEHAWLDEGLTTYATARVMEQEFFPTYYTRRYFDGFLPWVFRDLPLTREVDGDRMPSFRRFAESDAPSTPSFRYWPGSGGAITYDKTALWLHTLERMLGWETMQRILSAYFQRYTFKHPKPDDFFAVANEISGRDLTWFFDQVYRSSNAFDYSVEVRDATEPATVVVRRVGEGVFPVEIRARYQNGDQQWWNWDGRDRWKAFAANQGSSLVSVDVDPRRVLLLDVNRTNNSVSLDPAASTAARKWSLAWLIWLQDHLLTYGFFV